MEDELIYIKSKQQGVSLKHNGVPNFQIEIGSDPVAVIRHVAEFLVLDKPNMISACDEKGKDIKIDFKIMNKEEFFAEKQKVLDKLNFEKKVAAEPKLSEESKARVKDFAEDLADDGKRNRSNKKKKESEMEREGLMMKYFVLNPNKRGAYGKASRAAMLAYAHSIGIENKKLSTDLIDWVNRISHKMIDEDN